LALPFSKSKSLSKQSFADKVAQRDTAQKEIFLREVDEALREDELLSAFRRYAVPVGAVLAAGLLALGGYLWWSSHEADIRAGQAEQIVLALDKVDGGQQDAAFAQLTPVAQNGTAGDRAAARMLQAGIATRQGKLAQATQLLAEIAADDHAPKPFRDLATVRSVALNFDKLAPAEVIARLRPLAVPGAPFFGSAGELVGVAYLKQGHQDLAAPLFGTIARDPDVPDSLRARARQLAGALGFDAVQDITRAPAGDADAAPAPAPAATASPSAAPTAQPAAPAQSQTSTS
jgi:hypothetical protein